MDLKKFPLDWQRCPLIIGSIGYGDIENAGILYRWDESMPFEIDSKVELSQFYLQLKDCKVHTI